MSSKYREVYVKSRLGKCMGLSSDDTSVNELLKELERSRCRDEDLLIFPDFILNILPECRRDIIEQVCSMKKPTLIKMKIPPLLRPLTLFFNNSLGQVFGDKRVIGYYIPSTTIPEKDRLDYVVLEVPFNPRLFTYYLINSLPKPLACIALKLERITKFSLVGFTGFFFFLLTLYIATYVLTGVFDKKIAIPLASFISFETSLTWNFILHEHWTFKDLKIPRDRLSRVTRWVKFHLSSIGSLATQVTFVTLLSAYMGLPLYLSLLIGVLAGLLVNYTISRSFAWRE